MCRIRTLSVAVCNPLPGVFVWCLLSWIWFIETLELLFFFGKKGTISVAFVSLSLNNTVKFIDAYFHTSNDEISDEKFIYLLLFTLDRENCLMNVLLSAAAFFGEGFRRDSPSICLLFLHTLVIYSCRNMEYVELLWCGTWLNGYSKWHSKWRQEGVNCGFPINGGKRRERERERRKGRKKMFNCDSNDAGKLLICSGFGLFAVSSWQSDKYFDRQQTQNCQCGKLCLSLGKKIQL